MWEEGRMEGFLDILFKSIKIILRTSTIMSIIFGPWNPTWFDDCSASLTNILNWRVGRIRYWILNHFFVQITPVQLILPNFSRFSVRFRGFSTNLIQITIIERIFLWIVGLLPTSSTVSISWSKFTFPDFSSSTSCCCFLFPILWASNTFVRILLRK